MAREENRQPFKGIKFERTQRGFAGGVWVDYYGEECSIQDSSLATRAAIWLGVNEPSIKTFTPGEGWRDFPLPKEVMIASRMHLTTPMAKELIKILQRFVDKGTVAPEGL